MLLVKKCNIFFYLDLVKIRVQIRFNNVLNRKQTVFDYKDKKFLRLEKLYFSQKIQFFSLFLFGQTRTRNKV